MGLFDALRKKGIMIGSPMKGKCVSLKEVSDPTFSEEILGKGIAVIPEDGRVYAPADGTVTMVFDTLHAVTFTTDDGVELLIHVGLDTVTLKGDPFRSAVEAGEKVKKGDLLITADLLKIRAAGLDTVTPMIVCNSSDFASVEGITGSAVEAGTDVLEIRK